MNRERVRGPQWRVGGTRRLLAAVAVTVPVAVVLAALPALAWAEPITVTPSWENAPWKPKAQVILNLTAQVGYVCCVLAFLIGGAALAVGRLVGSYQGGNRGWQIVLGGAGGALIIAFAAQAVSWLIA